MRFANRLMALGTTLLLGGAQAALAQQSPVVEVVTSESRTVWYADPFWLGLGGVVVLIVIVLAVMASRGDTKSTTTVIR